MPKKNPPPMARDEYLPGPALVEGFEPDDLSEELPPVRVIVHDAVLHLYNELRSVECPSATRMKCAQLLADNAERWLGAAGAGEAADILSVVQKVTGQRGA